ncbi:Sec-independent protein translocase protein TatB [Pararhodospirillum photometricum]|uniref:Sec-independent protein translocase protein TatB n=1 Tax=Pararhodospirillum photometricum DSM 122 TaxID=1150469 RepID=H6SII6_PARPM|nr:Sec-independent protein translocase protein TatB [Pararhodospirillum photometricum]CCG06752.1 Sec-independent protein translocase protein tatB homolog [Pararhodospirillum photometricum DSM 122]
MFDIGWSELALIAVLALIIIGPKDLPVVLRTLGRWVRRLRHMGAEMQRHMDDIMRETGADEVREHMRAVSPAALTRKLDETIDPDGSLAETFRQSPADLLRPPPSATPPASEAPAAASPGVSLTKVPGGETRSP